MVSSAAAAALGPYARASALSCKAVELKYRGHDARALDKFRDALAAARAVGTEDCIVSAFLATAKTERDFVQLVRLLKEQPLATMDRPSVATKLREFAEALIGAAAVARRRRAAGATQPAEEAWYVAYIAAGNPEANSSTESEHVEAVASLGSNTTMFAACTLLTVLQAATKWAVFDASEFSSRVGAACDLVDEAVALAGPQRVKDTHSSYEGAMKHNLHLCVELWPQQRSTAAHAARLAEALKQLNLHGDLSADQQARYVQELEENRAKLVAARAAASAPELLRSCALASCGAKEAHVRHFSRCSACKTVVYCSKTCQLADWPAHKKACKAARKAAA